MLTRILTVFSVLLLGASVCSAQGVDSRDRAYENVYARPGRPTKTVYVWGQVANPGLWRVEEDIEFIGLLSVVRVPGVGQIQPEVRQITIVRVFRDGPSGRQEVYEARVEDILNADEEAPILQDGDVLVVESRQRRRIGFQTFTQLVGTAASLTLLVIRLAGLLD